MTEPVFRFDDGADYEQVMGLWSRLVAEPFLDWLALPSGLRWIDIGCGNGAFTQMAAQRCAPATMIGIDPSEGAIAYARAQRGSSALTFDVGDAMKLPLANDSVDVATMALVLFFVPEPAVGVAEMVRVVAPGGTVAAYTWDILAGGFPLDALLVEMREAGLVPPLPPSSEASRMPMQEGLWAGAGLESVETRVFHVERTFEDFEDYWTSAMKGSQFAHLSRVLPGEGVAQMKLRVQRRVDTFARPLAVSARANAVKGRVPIRR